MRKILIIIGLLISLAGYGQDIVNKRVLLDYIQTKLTAADTAFMEARTDSLVTVMADSYFYYCTLTGRYNPSICLWCRRG
jgi:hypothetical protein